MTHTHTRKPDPVRAWKHEEGETPPEWVTAGGVSEQDLSSGAVKVGYWIVEKRNGVIAVIPPELFEDVYDAI